MMRISRTWDASNVDKAETRTFERRYTAESPLTSNPVLNVVGATSSVDEHHLRMRKYLDVTE